jgi:flagellar M-ring protein FliF
LKDQFAKTLGWLKNLNEIQKTLIFTGFALSLLTLWGVRSLWQENDPYELLFQNLTPDDKNGILAHFSENQEQDYQLEGQSLYVKASKASSIRMRLAEKGLPADGSGLGWERFDQSSLLLTDFEQRIQKVRALQGELSRTINQLEPVIGSRVHLVIPDASPFIQDEQKTSASIYVKLRPDRVLNPSQITGIQHLVAQAVEGLDLKQVVIVNQNGEILTRDEDNSFDRLTAAQATYQDKVEKNLEEKIQTILSRVVGLGKVVSKVKAEIDFSQKETKFEDIDPDRSAVISSNRSKHSSKGSGLNPTGVPGTKSNVPGERDDLDTAPGLLQSHDETSELLNYEVSKSWTTKTDPVGVVQKLSVAVLVDGQMVDGVYTPRTEAEMTQITQLVENAIGFSENRGDQLTVQNAQFTLDPIEAGLIAASAQEKKEQMFQWLFMGLGIFLLGAGAIFLFRPYFRWLVHSPEQPIPSDFPSLKDENIWKSLDGTKNLMSLESNAQDFESLDEASKVIYISQKEPLRAAEALKKVIAGEDA